jgi:hypothetical protein
MRELVNSLIEETFPLMVEGYEVCVGRREDLVEAGIETVCVQAFDLHQALTQATRATIMEGGAIPFSPDALLRDILVRVFSLGYERGLSAQSEVSALNDLWDDD